VSVDARPLDASLHPLDRRALRRLDLRRPLLALPLTAYIVVFGIGPLSVLFAYSFWHNGFLTITRTFTLENYRALVHGESGHLYLTVLWKTLEVAVPVTAIGLTLAYPTAFFLARHLRRMRGVAFLLIAVPLITSYLVKIYAWRVVLDNNGLVNSVLVHLRIVNHPLGFLLFDRLSVGIALVSAVIPFMVLPIYASIERVPESVLEAARDLGAGSRRTFWRVLVPLTRRGILVACTFGFVISFGDFIASQLLGGASGIMIGKLIFSEFGLADNWPAGAAMAFAVLAVVMLSLAALRLTIGKGATLEAGISDTRLLPSEGGLGRISVVAAVCSFLLVYAPLVTAIVFSFNRSAAPILPMRGVTFAWYRELWDDTELRTAFYNTLKLMGGTTIIVLVLATSAALALRGRHFPGRGLYEAVVEMPFLIPEVIIGLALVTFFSYVNVSLSLRTVLVGHVLVCLGIAFRVIAARLESLPRSLEEAARDLGFGPIRTFLRVTLPGAASGLVTAAVIAAAISFDQTMITIFVTGTDNTVPTILWAKMRLGFTPELNALATLLLVGSLLLTLPVAWAVGRERRHATVEVAAVDALSSAGPR
jgi:spermidine/putrescine transport system permease protein